jgi:hypothetical protein
MKAMNALWKAMLSLFKSNRKVGVGSHIEVSNMETKYSDNILPDAEKGN